MIVLFIRGLSPQAMRSLWLVADQRLCACDELRMAATRLRLPTPSEMLEEQDIPFVVPVFEVGGLGWGLGGASWRPSNFST